MVVIKGALLLPGSTPPSPEPPAALLFAACCAACTCCLCMSADRARGATHNRCIAALISGVLMPPFWIKAAYWLIVCGGKPLTSCRIR